jgi:hypothetical protein
MAESENNEKTMFGRFYTSARKFKRRLGALPDGSKIWGGPYTYTQFTVMGVVAVLGWLTREIIGSSNAVTDTVLIILVAYGAGLVAGKAPEGKRSIISYLSSLMALVNHPGEGGKYKGKPIRLSAKARTIQREQKQQKKREAKNPPLGSHQSQLPSVKDIDPAPAGYGSSLNRLLNEYGLESATEGKQSW